MKKVVSLLAVAVLIICIFTACSSGAKDAVYSEGKNESLYSTADDIGLLRKQEVNTAGEGGDSAPNVTVADSRKLIKNISLSVETKEFESYLSALEASIAAVGGYTEAYSSDLNGYYYENYNRSASITARVPAEKLDEFLESAGKYGKITSRSEKISDITLDYVDTESRINALKTERDSLTELLSKGGSLENIIAIQERLSQVNYEIESYASQLRVLDNQVSYSTVEMRVNEVERVSAANESLGKQIKTRLLNNLSSIKADAKNLTVDVIGGLPYIIIWGAVIVIALLIIRKAVKRRKRKKSAAVPPTQS